MANVQFAGVTHRYEGTDRPAVDRLDLDIADGEFLVLVGPSGCGKSTSLRMLAGLESASDGRIEIGGTDVTHLAPRARDVAMVFQSYALYPNMTVEQNMGFALQNAGVGKAERRERVLEAARMLELEPLLGRKPAKLSGGQRQRVAMGRAIVRHPKVFCMDEPLSNLDAKLRVSTRSQIAALQRRLGTTTVYVTHDQVEAMTMGDRVAVMLDGRLQQVAKPRELYDNPVNTFVAAFIGSPGMNLIEAPVEGTVAVLGDLRIPLPTGASERERVVVGVRPESWDLVGAWRKGSAGRGCRPARRVGSRIVRVRERLTGLPVAEPIRSNRHSRRPEDVGGAGGAASSVAQGRRGVLLFRGDRSTSVAILCAA